MQRIKVDPDLEDGKDPPECFGNFVEKAINEDIRLRNLYGWVWKVSIIQHSLKGACISLKFAECRNINERPLNVDRCFEVLEKYDYLDSCEYNKRLCESLFFDMKKILIEEDVIYIG